MYSLTAHILLDVYDPLIRSITIGQFGFLRARQTLEVLSAEGKLISATTNRIIAESSHIFKSTLRYMPCKSRKHTALLYVVSYHFYLYEALFAQFQSSVTNIVITVASFMGNLDERNCLLSILRRSEHEEVWPTG